MVKKKVLYICNKCGYKTNRKSNYISHLNKKIPCTKNKINTIETITTNNINTNKKHEEELEKIKSEMEKYKLENIKYKIENEQISKKLEKEIKRNDDLITTTKNLSQENKILVKDAKSLRETIKINMTMNNYFIINSYGNEDTSHIDMNKLLEECKTLGQMIAKQIKLKHFSKEKKNHNLMLLRTIAKTYNKDGIWEPRDNVKLFIVNELIKKGIVNIDDYKKNENITFEDDKEKKYKKDKKYLSKNIPLPCMFNPKEAQKRLKEIQEQRKIDVDPKDTLWDNIEKKYKKEIKTAQKQLDVKNALINSLKQSVINKEIKASMVTFKNY